jgi:hypothetical protein
MPRSPYEKFGKWTKDMQARVDERLNRIRARKAPNLDLQLGLYLEVCYKLLILGVQRDLPAWPENYQSTRMGSRNWEWLPWQAVTKPRQVATMEMGTAVANSDQAAAFECVVWSTGKRSKLTPEERRKRKLEAQLRWAGKNRKEETKGASKTSMLKG